MAQRRITYGVQLKLCRSLVCSFIFSDKGEVGSHLPPSRWLRPCINLHTYDLFRNGIYIAPNAKLREVNN